MRKIAFAFVLFAWIVPAWAGSITISFTTAQGTLTRTVTVPDAHIARISDAYKGLLQLSPTSTNNQVFQAFAQQMFDTIKATVLTFERTQASQAAETGVAAVDMQ